MSKMVVEHVDETGAPCARHTAATPESLFRLAMVGSRARVFHHDCASKLQALVMVLDEIRQLTEHGEPQLVEAVEAALESMQEVNAVLNTNRALTRPSTRSAIMLRELVTSAAGWAGVTLHGTLPDEMVDVATPSTIHALSLAFDIAAGAGRGRALTVAALRTTREVELVLHTAPSQPANASEALAIATFVIARDGGRLWCAAAGDRIFVRLPCA